MHAMQFDPLNHAPFNTNNDLLFSFSLRYDLWYYILGNLFPQSHNF